MGPHGRGFFQRGNGDGGMKYPLWHFGDGEHTPQPVGSMGNECRGDKLPMAGNGDVDGEKLRDEDGGAEEYSPTPILPH